MTSRHPDGTEDPPPTAPTSITGPQRLNTITGAYEDFLDRVSAPTTSASTSC